MFLDVCFLPYVVSYPYDNDDASAGFWRVANTSSYLAALPHCGSSLHGPQSSSMTCHTINSDNDVLRVLQVDFIKDLAKSHVCAFHAGAVAPHQQTIMDILDICDIVCRWLPTRDLAKSHVWASQCILLRRLRHSSKQ
jgi:hypothetical protein